MHWPSGKYLENFLEMQYQHEIADSQLDSFSTSGTPLTQMC